MDIKREIVDMDYRIGELKNSLSDLEDILKDKYTSVIENVINEWENFTRPCLEEAKIRLENNE